MKSRIITTRMIAKRAGVSHSTVARVLRNDGRICPKTSQKVLTCAEKMGYRADPLIQAFAHRVRSGKTAKGTGILAWVDDVREEHEWYLPWHRRLHRAANARAKELGYSFERFSATRAGLSPERLVKILRTRAIRGVLMPMTLTDTWQSLSADDLAVVVLGPPMMGQQYIRVSADEHYNMSLAYQEARRLGYQRIGFATNCFQLDTAQGSLLSSYLLHQQHSPPQDRLPYFICDHPQHTNEQAAFEQWLDHSQPDAIICHHHDILKWLEESGRRVPEDIGLIHTKLARDVQGWTGINDHHGQQGALAVDTLVSQLVSNVYGRPQVQQEILVKGQWVTGKTTTRAHQTSSTSSIEVPSPYYHRRWFKQLPQDFL